MLVDAIEMQNNFHLKTNILYKHGTSKSWFAVLQRNPINSSGQK